MFCTLALCSVSVIAQQNDFRARSVEDSWGHQAMRINRWSVMHRVWDGLYDLKNIKAEDEIREKNNYGEKRKRSPVAEDLASSFVKLLQTEQELTDGRLVQQEQQNDLNRLISDGIVYQNDISNQDRQTQLDNMAAVYRSNEEANGAFKTSLLDTFNNVLENRLDIYDQRYQRDHDVAVAKLNEVNLRRDVADMESSYLESEVEKVNDSYNVQMEYDQLSGKYAQRANQLKQVIKDSASARSSEREHLQEESRKNLLNQYQNFQALMERNANSEASFYTRVKNVKHDIHQQLNADFVEVFDSVMKNNEQDRMDYLDQYSHMMALQKEKMQELNKERLLLIQQDKKQQMENEAIVRKLAGLPPRGSLVGSNRSPSGASSSFMGHSVPLLMIMFFLL